MAALILVAISVGMGNFAVAVSIGMSGVDARTRIEVALVFGLFEGGMPIVGLLIGSSVAHELGRAARWTGGGLLIAAGVYGLVKALRSGGEKDAEVAGLHGGRLVLAGLALSIDNLVVGFALGSHGVPVALAAAIIGAVSVLLSLIGLELGSRLGSKVGSRAELFGAGILVVIGSLIAAGVF